MDKVTAATVFNHTCDSDSLNATAHVLGLPRPMVSRYLDEMEKRAGVRPTHRSSRCLTITPVGEEALLKTHSLAQLSLDIGAVSGAQIPSGTLRVARTHLAIMHILASVLPSPMEQYPQLRVEVEIDSQPVNLVGERIDVAIHITESPESGTIARRLGGCKSVLCASAGYLHQHDTPETIDDLTRHSCPYYSGFAGQSWHFVNAQGQSVSIAIRENLGVGTSSLFCESAVSGAGIALAPEPKAREGLAQGKLIRLLPELQLRCLSIYDLYFSREHQSAGLHLLLGMLSGAQC